MSVRWAAFTAVAALLLGPGCRCGDPPPLLKIEDCFNNIDDDGNGLIDCRDPVCANAYQCARTVDSGLPDAGPPDSGVPDAGPPDAGPEDAGTVTYANACPGLPYSRVCGPDAGTAWRRVQNRVTNDLFVTAWAPRDGGELFIGARSVFRWNGATLTDDLPDAGLYVTRLEGNAPNDLWALTAEANDGARLLHRIDAGWTQLVHSTTVRPNDLALVGSEPWLLLPNAVARPSDGGFFSWPLPPDTVGQFLSAEPDGELWVGGVANPCPGLGDGGFCPRVVHGQPGAWAVDDWPCLGGSGAGYVWRRTPNEQVVAGGGFLTRRIDGGWTQPEPTAFSGARVAGTANDAWITAYDLYIGSQSTGVAHFNGCAEAPVFLYNTTAPTNPANGLTYGVASGGGVHWAVGASWDNTQLRWRGELWTNP